MNAAAINATLHDSRYQQCLLYTSPPNAAVAKGAREFLKKTQNRFFLPRTVIPWHKNRQGSWYYQDPNNWPKCRCQQVRTKSDNFFKLSLSVTGRIGQDASDMAARFHKETAGVRTIICHWSLSSTDKQLHIGKFEFLFAQKTLSFPFSETPETPELSGVPGPVFSWWSYSVFLD